MSATGRSDPDKYVRAAFDFYEIPGHPGYFVSAFGCVYTSKRCAFRELSYSKDQDGYPTCQLTENGKSRAHAVHRLVATTLLPPRLTPKHQVRHLDGNKQNNALTNLRWGTARENARDREQHGRTARGRRAGPAKLTEESVLKIRERIARGEKQLHIAREMGLCVGTINHIVTGRNWSWL